MRLAAWSTMAAVLGAGVPCAAWPMAGPDCCPEHAVVEPARPAAHATHATHAPAEPRDVAADAHHHDAPAGPAVAASMAECCLSAAPGLPDEAPRVVATAFVLHPPASIAVPRVPAAAVLAARPPDGPPPMGGTARHVLLSTFLI